MPDEPPAAAQPGKSTPRWRSVLAPGPRLVQLFIMGAAVAALAGGGYYALDILRSTAFNTDRAFRVLTQIVAQLDNFQGTMTSLLRLIPESSAECQVEADCKKGEWRRYTGKLDVPDIELSRVADGLTPRDDFKVMPACERRAGPRDSTPTASLANRYELWLRLDDPGRRFAIHACAAAVREPGIMQLHGRLQTGLPGFVSQSFFEQVLLTLEDGTVITTIRDSDNEAETAQVELQPSGDQGLIVADAKELLRGGARADANSDNPPSADAKNKPPAAPAAGNVPEHPVVFDRSLAGKKYRVYVLPFQPSVPWYVHADDGDKDAAGKLRREQMLYLVGLKQERLTDRITNALWPDGTFAIAVLSLLVVLVWPLLHLRYSTALQPVSQITGYATGVSFLLIPGVLAICAVWSWSRVQLVNWADAGATQYAKDIELHLVKELQTSIDLLEHYRDAFYQQYKGTPCTVNYPARAKLEWLPVMPVNEEDLDEIKRRKQDSRPSLQVESPTGDHACAIRYLRGNTLESSAFGAWSPLRTVIALDEDGESYAARLTAFGTPPGGTGSGYEVPQRLKFNVRDREYFRALLSSEAWKPRAKTPKRDSPWLTSPGQGFVAQRLFNRGDAARVLQIAVPRHGAGPEMEFAGAVTGDSRVYGLTASVSPLHLRFAVVDRVSGVVLFHTDDSRSLVENFLVETEDNEGLRARLSRRGVSDKVQQPWLEEHFNGRYLSEPHRFHSRPVAGVPWNIVVFYPTKELLDVAFQAGVAALGVFVAVAAGVVLVTLSIAYLRRGTGGRRVSLLWPRWQWRMKYRMFAWLGIGLLLVLAGEGLWAMEYGSAGLAGTLAAAGVMVGALVIHRRSRSQRAAIPGASSGADLPGRRASITERHYVACLCVATLLLSALPALYLGLRFYDLSLQNFVRNGLLSAARQVEHRHATIAGDLRRWDPDGKSRAQRYPDAWDLTDRLLPVPGLQTAHCPSRSGNGEVPVWRLTSFGEIPWANLGGPPAEHSPLRLIWSVTRESQAAQRRAWGSREVKAGQGGTEQLAISTKAACDMERTEPYFQREYDGHRIRMVMPYSSSGSSDSIPAGLRYGLTIALALLTLLIIGLVSLTIARRLFGSRNVCWWGARAEQAGEPRAAGRDDFKATWEVLRRDDQVFLHQLAQGRLVNPANEKSIRGLAEAGIIVFDPWPRIADPGFAAYALTAEKEEDFDAWELMASKNLWNSIRTPLLIVLLVVVGLLLWLSSSSMQIITTVLAGLASLVGYVSQTASVFRAVGATKD